MIEKVSVIGAGSWGTALAKLLSEKENLQVKLWVRKNEQAQIISQKKENPFYLAGIKLPESLKIVSAMQDMFPADLIVLAVPSHALRDICKSMCSFLQAGQIIVSCAKGLENETFLRMSQIIKKECSSSHVCVLSGPNHAKEVANMQPTATVIACEQQDIAEKVQHTFTAPYFRPYTNEDVAGVEFGGAFKNIIAMALGILDGLGYQDNAKAATMTRGLAEISRMGELLGAKPATFLGLSGMGDLISTCISEHSRNRWAGEQLAQGYTIEQVLAKTNMVVEGVKATQAAYALSQKLFVEMPITHSLYNVLYQGKNVDETIKELMSRDYKPETH